MERSLLLLIAGLCLSVCGFTEGIEKAKPVPKGERLLGIAVTEAADKNFDTAFQYAKSAGMEVVSLHLAWDDIEKTPGKYDSPWPAVANGFYPVQKVKMCLTLATLDTNKNRIPADLRDKPFDDPAVLQRLNGVLDYLLAQMSQVDFTSLAIGNEIDVSLGEDTTRWQQYTRLFQAAKAHLRERKPGLKVGATVTFNGLTGKTRPQAAALNKETDLVLVTYYALNADFTVREPATIAPDFQKLLALYPERKIHFVEAGYPSGAKTKSSPEKQAQFVEMFFAAWDRHAKQVGLALFNWLTDYPADNVVWAETYYGVHNPAFLDYIATLGLRTNPGSGEDKPAFRALKKATHARGWGK